MPSQPADQHHHGHGSETGDKAARDRHIWRRRYALPGRALRRNGPRGGQAAFGRQPAFDQPRRCARHCSRTNGAQRLALQHGLALQHAAITTAASISGAHQYDDLESVRGGCPTGRCGLRPLPPLMHFQCTAGQRVVVCWQAMNGGLHHVGAAAGASQLCRGKPVVQAQSPVRCAAPSHRCKQRLPGSGSPRLDLNTTITPAFGAKPNSACAIEANPSWPLQKSPGLTAISIRTA